MAIFNTVYGGKWPWKPWANTLAYYTFDNQTLLNSATNTVDASWYSWAWAFWEWYNGWYSANISSWWPIALSIKIPQQDFTICSCIKFNSYPPASWTWYWWFGNLWTSYSRIHCQFYYDWSTPVLQFWQYQSWSWYSQSGVTPATWILSANTWYKIVLVRNWTTVSIYIDWQLIWSWTDNYRNSTQTDTYYLWTSFDINARKLNWYIDNVIIENKARTLDEIQKY